MNAGQPELLTAREVAGRLGIGVRTVWRWTAAGQLPAPIRLGKTGRTVRWKATAIAGFLDDLYSSTDRVPRLRLVDEPAPSRSW